MEPEAVIGNLGASKQWDSNLPERHTYGKTKMEFWDTVGRVTDRLESSSTST